MKSFIWAFAFSIFPTILYAQVGSIINLGVVKSKYASGYNVDVWLPANYSASKQYAVIYMHDGQMLFDSTTTWNKQAWMVQNVVANLMAENKIVPAIIIAIHNNGQSRHADYTPQIPFKKLKRQQQTAMYHDTTAYGNNVFANFKVNSDNYLKFLVNELKPLIDKRFSTYTDKSQTIIMGSSMGGLISLYAICQYPEIFGKAACMSTHWPLVFKTDNNPFPDAMLQYLIGKLPQPESHILYFDMGTMGIDSLYESTQIQVDALCIDIGYNSNNFMSVVFEGADHNEKAWHKRLHIPLQFLLKP